MNRPDKTSIALLQARHVLNEWENKQILSLEYGNEIYNPVHDYAWGLFKTTLLKALKDREDLHLWSPDLFQDDISCIHCQGNGKNTIDKNSSHYKEAVLDSFIQFGDELFSHCSPCQGSGILTLLDQKLNEKNCSNK